MDEPTKASTADENPDEEIADDLSEISDEFDDILELQEVISHNLFQPELQLIEFQCVQDVQMKEQPPQADVEKSPAKEASSPEPPTSEMKPKSNSPAEKPIDEEIEQAAPAEPASVTKISEDADRSKDLSDDIDLDFEEISDGELEEEACLRYVFKSMLLNLSLKFSISNDIFIEFNLQRVPHQRYWRCVGC